LLLRESARRPELDRQDDWLAHGVTRDHLAELTSWLESVEYEHEDF
jgi:hypothetical protein